MLGALLKVLSAVRLATFATNCHTRLESERTIGDHLGEGGAYLIGDGALSKIYPTEMYAIASHILPADYQSAVPTVQASEI